MERNIIYNDFDELIEDDPEAVISKDGYLERPDDGWIKCSYGFIGIGYRGNEGGEFKDVWSKSKKGLGHIPDTGYG